MPRASVTDHVAHAADVSAAQVLAYCRQVLVQERGWVETHYTSLQDTACFEAPTRTPGFDWVTAPLRDDDRQFNHRVRELCEALVRIKLYTRPSEALFAMLCYKERA